MRHVEIAKIRLNGGTQPRGAIDFSVVDEYANAMTEGAAFPPVTVYFDGSSYWLADGFHRVHAAQKIGQLDIAADVHQGSQRDAILESVGANAAHGMRRTNEDKRRAVMRLLSDDEWSRWSDREIARRCAVHHNTVEKIRQELTGDLSSDNSEPRTYTTKHGTTATMNTENIGKTRPGRPVYETPISPDGPDVFAARRQEPEDVGTSGSGESAQPAKEPVYDFPDPFEKPEFAYNIIVDIIDRQMNRIQMRSVKHEVVNMVLKYLRTLSVEMNREYVNEG